MTGDGRGCFNSVGEVFHGYTGTKSPQCILLMSYNFMCQLYFDEAEIVKNKFL